jgi:hypothetical protein
VHQQPGTQTKNYPEQRRTKMYNTKSGGHQSEWKNLNRGAAEFQRRISNLQAAAAAFCFENLNEYVGKALSLTRQS